MEEQGPGGTGRGPSTAPGRRIGPAHLFALAALLQFVAIPLPWASARVLEGSVTIDGFEAALFGFCAFVCGALCVCAAVAAGRDARGWMLLWALPALAGSLLFGVTMVVLDSILTSAIEWVFAERAAQADAGMAVWLVLTAGILTLVAVGWALSTTPLPAEGRPGLVRATLTLPPVVWRAARAHYQGAGGPDAPDAGATLPGAPAFGGPTIGPPVAVPPVAVLPVAGVPAAEPLVTGAPVDDPSAAGPHRF